MDSGKCFVPMDHRTNFVDVSLVLYATGRANPNRSQFVNERSFRSLRSYFSTHPHLPCKCSRLRRRCVLCYTENLEFIYCKLTSKIASWPCAFLFDFLLTRLIPKGVPFSVRSFDPHQHLRWSYDPGVHCFPQSRLLGCHATPHQVKRSYLGSVAWHPICDVDYRQVNVRLRLPTTLVKGMVKGGSLNMLIWRSNNYWSC